MALTHMRGPNDRRLAEQATGIDLILGGHDHDYFSQKVDSFCTWFLMLQCFVQLLHLPSSSV